MRILLHHGPISRTEICQMTRLTPATISNVIGGLMESALVVELGTQQQPDSHRVGRRRLLVDLNTDGLYVIGAYLGITHIRVGIGDLRGKLLAKTAVPNEGHCSPEYAFSVVYEQVQEVLRRAQVPRERVCGIGVGSVGLVNSNSGEIVDMPYNGWEHVAAKRDLEGLLGLPVVVDNGRRTMAIAESSLGLGQDVNSVMLVHVSTTVGGAVVFRQEVLEGANYAAGKLGHLIVDEDGERCACGRYGCLDSVASGAAIVAQARRAASKGEANGLLALAGGRVDSINAETVFKAAEEGDETAGAIVGRSAYYVGVGVAHYVSLFDPEIIILSGDVALRGGDRYKKQVAAVANERAYRPVCRKVELVYTNFGTDLEVIGPISLALQRFVYSADSPALTGGSTRRGILEPLEESERAIV
ncbi:MAG: ROK family protein [Chloroflexota bacterium]